MYPFLRFLSILAKTNDEETQTISKIHKIGRIVIGGLSSFLGTSMGKCIVQSLDFFPSHQFSFQVHLLLRPLRQRCWPERQFHVTAEASYLLTATFLFGFMLGVGSWLFLYIPFPQAGFLAPAMGTRE
jgi:hypothetical protein